VDTRRKFLQKAVLTGTGLLIGNATVNKALAAENEIRLTVLHTNDVHSRIDPFPMDGSRNQGLGGVASRAALIRQIRAQEEHVLLLDAGDIFQGTPYFNIYKGEPEMKAMAAMNYDACTMGNHDFDGGMENFANQLRHANFPVIISNYDFTGTPMELKILPYKVFRKGRLKIGVTGVGIELQGLVPENLYGGTKYLDPVQKVNETADILVNKERCDLVICLSHLGYDYKGENKVSDIMLAQSSENIDLIIGGHTHTFLDAPVVYKNRKGNDVVVNQVGWAGIQLGRLDFTFSSVAKKQLSNARSITVKAKEGD
jgi:5'-nucleotidase